MIDTHLSVAAAAWPGVRVPISIFQSYALERAEDGQLATLRLADLYLACACASGDEKAIEVFRRTLGPALRHAIARAVPQSLVDEAEQRVLFKLFVDEPHRRAAIGSYNGRGKLSTWVQVVARREARNTLRREMTRGVCDVRKAELQLRYRERDDAMPRSFRREMCDAFRRAFATALERLSAHERNLLRHECLEGLTIEETAKRYGVSSSTIARWRARCRIRIFRLTRDAFRDLESRHDFDGTLSMLESELDVGLSQLLGSEVEPTAPSC